MIVVVGLIVLFVAVLVGIVGVLSNAGPAHAMTENFSVFGYHVTGSTGTLFLYGIVVGGVAMLGMSALLAGARRTAGREREARRDLARSERETAYLNRDREALLEQQHTSAAPGSGPNPVHGTESDGVPTARNRISLRDRWTRRRSPSVLHPGSGEPTN